MMEISRRAASEATGVCVHEVQSSNNYAGILTALLLVDASVYCQDPKPTPSPETRTTAPATAGQEKTTNPTTTTSSPAPSPEPDYWNQEFMTADWGGTRSQFNAFLP